MFKADRLDNGEEVEGLLSSSGGKSIIVTDFHVEMGVGAGGFKINPQTLKQKVGENWYSKDELEELVALGERVKDIMPTEDEIDEIIEEAGLSDKLLTEDQIEKILKDD